MAKLATITMVITTLGLRRELLADIPIYVLEQQILITPPVKQEGQTMSHTGETEIRGETDLVQAVQSSHWQAYSWTQLSFHLVGFHPLYQVISLLLFVLQLLLRCH